MFPILPGSTQATILITSDIHLSVKDVARLDDRLALEKRTVDLALIAGDFANLKAHGKRLLVLHTRSVARTKLACSLQNSSMQSA